MTDHRRAVGPGALRVPESQRASLALLATIPEEQFSALAAALEQLSPTISWSDFADRAASAAPLPPDQTRRLVSMTATLYAIRDSEDIPLEEFVASVTPDSASA